MEIQTGEIEKISYDEIPVELNREFKVDLGDTDSTVDRNNKDEETTQLVLLQDLYPVRSKLSKISFHAAVADKSVQFFILETSQDGNLTQKESCSVEISNTVEGKNEVEVDWLINPGEYLAITDKAGSIAFTVDKNAFFQVDKSKCTRCANLLPANDHANTEYTLQEDEDGKEKIMYRNYCIELTVTPSRFVANCTTELEPFGNRLDGHVLLLSKYRAPYSGKLSHLMIKSSDFIPSDSFQVMIYRSRLQKSENEEINFHLTERLERIASYELNKGSVENELEGSFSFNPPIYVAKGDVLAWYNEGESSIQVLDTEGAVITGDQGEMKAGEGMLSTIKDSGEIAEIPNTVVNIEMTYERIRNSSFNVNTSYFPSPLPPESEDDPKVLVDSSYTARDYTLKALDIMGAIPKVGGGATILKFAIELFWKEEDPIEKACEEMLKIVKDMIHDAAVDANIETLKKAIYDAKSVIDFSISSYDKYIDIENLNEEDYEEYIDSIKNAVFSIVKSEVNFEGEKLAYLPYYPLYGSLFSATFSALAYERLEFQKKFKIDSVNAILDHLTAVSYCTLMLEWLQDRAKLFYTIRDSFIVPKAHLKEYPHPDGSIDYLYSYTTKDNDIQVLYESETFTHLPSEEEKEECKKEWRKDRYAYQARIKKSSIKLWDASYGQQTWFWADLVYETRARINLNDNFQLAESCLFQT